MMLNKGLQTYNLRAAVLGGQCAAWRHRAKYKRFSFSVAHFSTRRTNKLAKMGSVNCYVLFVNFKIAILCWRFSEGYIFVDVSMSDLYTLQISSSQTVWDSNLEPLFWRVFGICCVLVLHNWRHKAFIFRQKVQERFRVSMDVSHYESVQSCWDVKFHCRCRGLQDGRSSLHPNTNVLSESLLYRRCVTNLVITFVLNVATVTYPNCVLKENKRVPDVSFEKCQ